MPPGIFVLGVISLACLLPGTWVAEASDDDCLCSCFTNVVPVTEEEKKLYVEEETKKITQELIVPAKNLSATTRRKESATDDRPSAQNVGYLGITMLCMSMVIIVALDANYIIQIFSFFKKEVA